MSLCPALPFAIRGRGLALSLALILAAFSAAAAGPGYQLEKAVTLDSTDTGWDYQALDANRGRLYIGHRADGLQVYDTRAGKVIKTIEQSTGANNVALSLELDIGISGTTDGNVVVFRPSTMATLSRTKSGVGGFDGATFDPYSRRFAMVGDADTGARTTPVLFFDSRTGAQVGRVSLPSAKVDAPRADGLGNIFLPLRDQNAVAKVDTQRMAVVGRFPLTQCALPSALEMDLAHQRVLVGCRGNATTPPVLVVLDAENGKQIGKWPIGRGVDEVMYDPSRGLVVTANGEDGTMTLIRQRTADIYKLEETISTRPMARTGVLDELTGRIYLVTASFSTVYREGMPSVTRFVPNTFTVLTYMR
jgi:hypothetical protein